VAWQPTIAFNKGVWRWATRLGASPPAPPAQVAFRLRRGKEAHPTVIREFMVRSLGGLPGFAWRSAVARQPTFRVALVDLSFLALENRQIRTLTRAVVW